MVSVIIRTNIHTIRAKVLILMVMASATIPTGLEATHSLKMVLNGLILMVMASVIIAMIYHLIHRKPRMQMVTDLAMTQLVPVLTLSLIHI